MGVCAGLEKLTDNSITGILSFPTSCWYNFYSGIMVAFFLIVSFAIYNGDRKRGEKGDMIGAFGISAIATIFVAMLGTSLNIIQQDIFIKIFVGGIVFIIIWLVRK